MRNRKSLIILLGLAVCLSCTAKASNPEIWTTGGKSVLIMPVGFTDCPAPTLGPAGGWTNLMTNLNQYYIRQSYSNFWISNFVVTPVVDMGVSYTNYKSYLNWQTSPFLPAVRAKAKLMGYDSDNYDFDLMSSRQYELAFLISSCTL